MKNNGDGDTTKTPDFDIDVSDREKLLEHISLLAREGECGEPVCASLIKNGNLEKHPTGIYYQDVPYYRDREGRKIATLPYNILEALGFPKIDLINNHSYRIFESNEELDSIAEEEVDWSLLQRRDIVEKLPHVSGYVELLKKYKPRSILELAAVLSIIRPAKKHLIGKSMDYILRNVWKRDENQEGYFFKKSHAVSYAMLVVLILKKLGKQSKG